MPDWTLCHACSCALLVVAISIVADIRSRHMGKAGVIRHCLGLTHLRHMVRSKNSVFELLIRYELEFSHNRRKAVSFGRFSREQRRESF